MVRGHLFSPFKITNLVFFLIISDEPQIGKKILIMRFLIQQADIAGQPPSEQSSSCPKLSG
jgi:hypothetical protein